MVLDRPPTLYINPWGHSLSYTLFFIRISFWLRLSCSYFWTRFWPVISSLRFPDQFASSMNIFQNTNFKISNLRLAVLIKVVLIKKCTWNLKLVFLSKQNPSVLIKNLAKLQNYSVSIYSNINSFGYQSWELEFN